MKVHIYLIESVPDQDVMSVEWIAMIAAAFLSKAGKKGVVTCRSPNTPADIADEIEKLCQWYASIPENEIVVLWLSMHGEMPASPEHLGTAGLAGSSTTEEPHVVDWYAALQQACGRLGNNCIVLLDICWGGSATLPRALTHSAGVHPRFVLGPTRAGLTMELITASVMLFAHLRKSEPSHPMDLDKAHQLVDSVNELFDPDPVAQREFYRCWSWDDQATLVSHPGQKPTP